jgi:NarL family two-component system response regulator LiaR
MKTPFRTVLVDDDPMVVKVITSFLAQEPWIEVVGTAPSGTEGLAMIERLKPDIVLLDLELPDVDGYVMTSKIKAHQPAPAVIILTGHDTQDFRQAATGVEADGFVSKAHFTDTLVPLIRSLAEKFTAPSNH